MSRVGKATIKIPSGVTVNYGNAKISIKGPKGELNLDVHPKVKLDIQDQEIKVNVIDQEEKESKALWGTFRILIYNMIGGVTKGYEKKMELNGTGYRALMQGNKLVMELGFSHPVTIEAPQGIKIEVEKNLITVSGIDKQQVGQWAAKIREQKRVEPYKGKGIKYVEEFVRRKVGKKAGGDSA